MASIEIIPTVVPASPADVIAALERCDFAGTLHVDFADGIFAPNTTWPYTASGIFDTAAIATSVSVEGIVLEAHLMVQEPLALGEQLARGGFARIIGHIEAMGESATQMMDAWRAAGASEAGLGVLFATSLKTLEPHIDACDVVQMMSIASIGVQGIPYEDSAPERIASLHAKHPELLIADDGGVSEKNIAALARAGVRRFCVGSALSKSAEPASTYERLRSLAEGAVQ